MICHGRIACRRCWACDEDVQEKGNFRLVRDPGHWGASEPQTLVLGISKGNTQSRAYAQGAFEEVAFKGIRRRILEIFHSVGLLIGETPSAFERRFTQSETDFAFASVVRCSLTGMDRKKRIHTADSPNVLRAFRPGSEGYQFVVNCIDQYLLPLSVRTRLVLLLGNTDGYISTLKTVLAAKRSPIMTINEVGYWAGGVKFVHLAHPSKGNGHFNAFLRGEGKPGSKRDSARAALVA
jgi:hypothetical protein